MVRRKLFALIVCLSFINCTLSDSNDDAIKDVINTSNTETRNPKPVRINTHQSSSDCVIKDKCKSDLDVCCNPPSVTDRPVTTATKKPPVHSCGKRNPDGVGFHITNNKNDETQFGEFPWMVAILREEAVDRSDLKLNVYKCGGALIHPQVVLTAAHCVSGKNTQFKVRAGEWDTQTTKEIYPHQEREVKTVISHPHYNASVLFNDVALLILNEPVEIADNVDVLCLPPQDTKVEDARCFASGWGKDLFGREGKYQVILKKVDLPIIGRDKCQEDLRKTRLGKFFELHETFICTGGEKGKDTCRGDGGSPLVCPIPDQKNKYYQAGIVAWGLGCVDVPGVYVNVPKFKTWIDDQMAYHNFDKSVYEY